MTNNDETTTGSLLKRQLLEDAKRWKTTGDGQFRVRFFFFRRIIIIIVRVDSSLFLVGVVCSARSIRFSVSLSLSLSRARGGGGARVTPLFSLPLELTIARGSLRLHACRRRPTTPKRSSRTRKRKRVWNTCYSAPVPMMPTRGQKMARTRRRIRWIRSKRRGFC